MHLTRDAENNGQPGSARSWLSDATCSRHFSNKRLPRARRSLATRGAADCVLDATRKSGFPARILPACLRSQNPKDPRIWASLIMAVPLPDLAWFIDPVSARECRRMHGVGSDQP